MSSSTPSKAETGETPTQSPTKSPTPTQPTNQTSLSSTTPSPSPPTNPPIPEDTCLQCHLKSLSCSFTSRHRSITTSTSTSPQNRDPYTCNRCKANNEPFCILQTTDDDSFNGNIVLYSPGVEESRVRKRAEELYEYFEGGWRFAPKGKWREGV